jgi:endoglucanase
MQSLADEIRVDALGNLIARKRPRKTAKDVQKIMVAAPMDEIGVMVSHVDKNGFVRFSPIGSVLRSYILGGRVRFADGAQGVIGFDRLENVNELPTLDKIYIDVGATSQKDCPVQIGDVAAFDRPYLELGDRLVANSMGNRVGVLIALETLRRLKPTAYDIYFAFTTQSEVGLRGAATSAYGIDPDLGIALDVTPAGDTPHSPGMQIALGKGPCIKLQSTSMLADTGIVNWILRAAEKNKIPVQREVLFSADSDASSIQQTRAGVPSGCISVPVRYLHSPSEMVDYSDVQNAVKLLRATLQTSVGL